MTYVARLATTAFFLICSLLAAPQDQPAPGPSPAVRRGPDVSPPTHKMSFEVASVRQCQDGTRSAMQASPGWLGITCWPLRRVIEDAYEVFASGTFDRRYPFPYTPIEGIPDWVKSTRYSITAKAEGPETQGSMRGPLMQALLKDRFHLRIRSVTREVPAYLMTAGDRAART
jgi:uncharacterized protein (TIGR03435 family)